MIECPRCKGRGFSTANSVGSVLFDKKDCRHCDGEGTVGYGQIWRCWVWESWGGHQALLSRERGCWVMGNRGLNGPEEIEDAVVEPIARLKEMKIEKCLPKVRRKAMKQIEVIERWAKIIYEWAFQCGVELGLARKEEMMPWEDFPKKETYLKVAKKLWEEVG